MLEPIRPHHATCRSVWRFLTRPLGMIRGALAVPRASGHTKPHDDAAAPLSPLSFIVGVIVDHLYSKPHPQARCRLSPRRNEASDVLGEIPTRISDRPPGLSQPPRPLWENFAANPFVRWLFVPLALSANCCSNATVKLQLGSTSVVIFGDGLR